MQNVFGRKKKEFWYKNFVFEEGQVFGNHWGYIPGTLSSADGFWWVLQVVFKQIYSQVIRFSLVKHWFSLTFSEIYFNIISYILIIRIYWLNWLIQAIQVPISNQSKIVKKNSNKNTTKYIIGRNWSKKSPKLSSQPIKFAVISLLYPCPFHQLCSSMLCAFLPLSSLSPQSFQLKRTQNFSIYLGCYGGFCLCKQQECSGP